jgi:hypothetical protein
LKLTKRPGMPSSSISCQSVTRSNFFFMDRTTVKVLVMQRIANYCEDSEADHNLI